ncbi:MAG: hypothetical protein QM754_18285 [Tepidisphaeraceae bacterium]
MDVGAVGEAREEGGGLDELVKSVGGTTPGIHTGPVRSAGEIAEQFPDPVYLPSIASIAAESIVTVRGREYARELASALIEQVETSNASA